MRRRNQEIRKESRRVMSGIQASKTVLKTAGDSPQKIAIWLAVEPTYIPKTADDPPNIAFLLTVEPGRV